MSKEKKSVASISVINLIMKAASINGNRKRQYSQQCLLILSNIENKLINTLFWNVCEIYSI